MLPRLNKLGNILHRGSRVSFSFRESSWYIDSNLCNFGTDLNLRVFVIITILRNSKFQTKKKKRCGYVTLQAAHQFKLF